MLSYYVLPLGRLSVDCQYLGSADKPFAVGLFLQFCLYFYQHQLFEALIYVTSLVKYYPHGKKGGCL